MWAIIRPVSSYLPSSLITPPPHSLRTQSWAGGFLPFPYTGATSSTLSRAGGVKEEVEKHNDIVMPAMYGDWFASRWYALRFLQTSIRPKQQPLWPVGNNISQFFFLFQHQRSSRNSLNSNLQRRLTMRFPNVSILLTNCLTWNCKIYTDFV